MLNARCSHPLRCASIFSATPVRLPRSFTSTTNSFFICKMKIDLLAFGAHPDDVELSCSGTLIKHVQLGYKVGIVDLTAGELGTRGTADIRAAEATRAAEIMGISVR